MNPHPTAFISYSWDSDEHRQWVNKLSTRLRADGIDVTLDQWHAVPGDQLPDFMSSSIEKNDFVLIVCTPAYREKSQRKVGGVRYEGDIITSELFMKQNQRKFIPILRSGKWVNAAPVWLSGKYYVDLNETEYYERNYLDMLNTLKGERPEAPPLGKIDLAENKFRQLLRKPDYLNKLHPDDFNMDFVRQFALSSTNEFSLRLRALELYFKWGLDDENFLEAGRLDSSRDFRRELASKLGVYETYVTEEDMAALLSDDDLSVRKTAIDTAYALIQRGQFTSAILEHASKQKSWESRYAAIRKIIAVDDEDSVRTLLHFEGTNYHRARDRIREYFESLYKEGRLQDDQLAGAVELLTKYATDGQSSDAVTKRLRRALDLIQDGRITTADLETKALKAVRDFARDNPANRMSLDRIVTEIQTVCMIDEEYANQIFHKLLGQLLLLQDGNDAYILTHKARIKLAKEYSRD